MSRRKLELAVEEVPSAKYLSIVWKYLTESLCQEVFAVTRERERQRKWTLYALVWLWIALLQSRYGSQTRALLEAPAGSALFPPVDASPEAFFQKVQNVRPVFFRNVFRAFTTALKAEAPPTFERELPLDPKVFPEVYAVDGSRLEKVARMLKVARKTTKAIIPGSMEAVYDLRRGLLHELHFDPDGCVGEITMFEQVLPSIRRGALILNDRYYAKPKIWQQLAAQGVWMISRHSRTVKKRRLAVNGQLRRSALSYDDWLVEMGLQLSPIKAVPCPPPSSRRHRQTEEPFDEPFRVAISTPTCQPNRLTFRQSFTTMTSWITAALLGLKSASARRLRGAYPHLPVRPQNLWVKLLA